MFHYSMKHTIYQFHCPGYFHCHSLFINCSIKIAQPVPENSFLEISDLKNKIRNNNDFQDILFLNIRSIRSNFQELIDLIHELDHRFTYIILNETWLEKGEE